MDNSSAGIFLLSLTCVSVLTVFFRLGLDNPVLRYIGSRVADLYSQKKFNTALTWVALFSIPISIFASAYSIEISEYFFYKTDLSEPLKWMFLSIPAISISTLISFAFQGKHKIIATSIFQNLGISTLFLIVYFIGLNLTWLEPNPGTAAKIYLLSSCIIAVLAILSWYRQHNIRKFKFNFFDRELLESVKNLWPASTMSLIVIWSSVLVCGVLLGPVEVALLSAAQRTAGIINLVLLIVNMISAPKFAYMWNKERYIDLEKYVKLSTRLMLVVSFPLLLLFLCIPDLIMELFGEGFGEGAELLIILSIGQFINVATGSVCNLLNMTGHERDYRQITIVSGTLTILFAVALTAFVGVQGAAIATALGLTVQNTLAMCLVKIRLGYWVL